MAIWQWALLGLGLAWLVQSAGVWLQMMHYSDVFKGVTARYADGYVGAGQKRGRFGRGTIAIIVVDSDLIVRRLLVMSGRSVLARFRRVEEPEGQPLGALQNSVGSSPADPGLAEAVTQAIAQIETARAKAKDEEDVPGALPATA
ncbi:MAG: transcriptional regulator [Hyphomicrobiaceae bacterium]|nr:transcriptional regulator [Hyphomicrobiaceae bacterium]